MALSEGLASLQKLVSDLEEKAKRLEARCTTLEGKNQQLIDELSKARKDNQVLTKRCLTTEKKLELIQSASEKGEGKRSGGTGSQEIAGRCAMAIFPAELWKMILEKVVDPKDLKSCYEACPELQPLLEDQRTTFLFPDVVKVLVAKVPGFGITSNEAEISSNPLMNYRLVCRHWKHGVDRFLEQQSPSFCPIPETHLIVPSFQFKYSNFSMRYGFERMPCPTPSRYVVYNENFSGRTPSYLKAQFQNVFTQSLQSVGGEVWSFKMIFAGQNWVQDSDSAYGYNTLLDYLRLMPNLKELYLCKPLSKWWDNDYCVDVRGDWSYIWELVDDYYEDVGSDSDSGDSDKSFQGQYTEHPLERLERKMLENPFPTLPTVKRIILEDCPPALIETVLRANPQAEQLKILVNNQVKLYLENLELPKLHQACLINLPNENIELGRWPLTKLTLYAPNIRFWDDLFSQLCRKGLRNSLKELDLRLFAPCYSQKNLRLDLPNLTTLKLRLNGYLDSIDFILPLQNLEHLEVDFNYLDETRAWTPKFQSFLGLEDIVETVKMHGYVHNLKNSNVWQLFANLKQVKARTDWDKKEKSPVENPEWYCCTRDEIEI